MLVVLLCSIGMEWNSSIPGTWEHTRPHLARGLVADRVLQVTVMYRTHHEVGRRVVRYDGLGRGLGHLFSPRHLCRGRIHFRLDSIACLLG